MCIAFVWPTPSTAQQNQTAVKDASGTSDIINESETSISHNEGKANWTNSTPSLLVPTYLGNDKRRFYGRGTPVNLELEGKFNLGKGQTRVRDTIKTWAGAGWTSQPSIIRDDNEVYLITGSNDHHLRKIRLRDLKEIWKYQFPDVIKGSPTVFINEKGSDENRVIILQGSRRGINSYGPAAAGKPVNSFKAISFRTGRHLWDLDVTKTASFSRDNDSSALYLGGNRFFNASENSIGYFVKVTSDTTKVKKGAPAFAIEGSVKLFNDDDIRRHGGNIVAEASPSKIGNTIYLPCGSGHIFGIDIPTRKIVWDFPTGSDMDGSAIITKSEKLICSIEKEFIVGKGGLIMLDPTRPPAESVIWFLPTENRNFASWQGGIIGSASVNDEYNGNQFPRLFATAAIDGFLYIGSQTVLSGEKAPGPDGKTIYPLPRVVARIKIGPSISTPVFTDGNMLVAAGYSGVRLFSIEYKATGSGDKDALPGDDGKFYKVSLTQKASFKTSTSFESTPVIHDGRVIISSKDGYLYVLK
jgi:outer membrane protein assembly factor BamB